LALFDGSQILLVKRIKTGDTLFAEIQMNIPALPGQVLKFIHGKCFLYAKGRGGFFGGDTNGSGRVIEVSLTRKHINDSFIG